MQPKVAELVTYPIKGCAGSSVRQAAVISTGLEHDRTFMIVDQDGVFRSQRRAPWMATIRPAVSDGGERLTLSAPGAAELAVDVRFDGKRLPVTVWKHDGEAIDQGEAAADWVSDILGPGHRLVRVADDHDRPGSGQATSPTTFTDSTAITVASAASLDELNARILEHGGEPVPMSRFRPNIVVGGWAEPHTEDRVRRMTIGTAAFAYAKLDIRCQVTTIDQHTGEKRGPEPLRTLASYRRDPKDGGVAFAMKAAVARPGEITIGDAVDVSDWGAGLTA